MGLFDQVLGAAGITPAQGQDGKTDLLGTIAQFATSTHPGGLQGIVQAFEAGGLGDVAKSWLSDGQNLAVTPQQIQAVLGEEHVRNLATQLGVDPDQAASHLAEYLPMVIDKLSPGGSLPQGSELLADGLGLLKSKLLG